MLYNRSSKISHIADFQPVHLVRNLRISPSNGMTANTFISS